MGKQLIRDEQRTQLIRLAADMLRTDAPPSTYLEDHEHLPQRVPMRWWRWMRDRLTVAEDERKEWSRKLRRIADTLSNDKG